MCGGCCTSSMAATPRSTDGRVFIVRDADNRVRLTTSGVVRP